MKKLQLKPRTILDVGCGPMFISSLLVVNSTSEYIGVDIMHTNRLKKYRKAMKYIGLKTVEVVRASAEQLPFRDNVFDLSLCLDLLEHLRKPKECTAEIYRVARNGSLVGISLPLENLFQRLSRIGFIIMKIAGDPIIKKTRSVPIATTPEYHYIGDVKSYDGMAKMLEGVFSFLHTRFTPIGFHKSINVNAVHILQKK